MHKNTYRQISDYESTSGHEHVLNILFDYYNLEK
jgi:hypothetical protein